MPRPSSPPSAKASIRSPYALDRSQQNPCAGRKPPTSRRRSTSCAWARICQTISSFIRIDPRSTGDAGATLPSRYQRTPAMRQRANSFFPKAIARCGGARRVRTDDLMLAKHALYQLSYGPCNRGELSENVSPEAPGVTQSVVGPGGLEPPTSRLSGVCSNQLSYRPLDSAPPTGRTPQRCRRPGSRSRPDLAAVSQMSLATGAEGKERRRRRRPAPV